MATNSLQSGKLFASFGAKAFLFCLQAMKGFCCRVERLCAFPVFLALSSIFLTSSVLAQSQLPADQSLDDLDFYQNRLEELEQQYDRYDPRLVEILGDLGRLSIELDQFDDADEIFDRAIQIIRISEGLYTETQFPYLLLSAKGDVRRGNWRDANEKLVHIAALHEFEPRVWDGELVNEIVELSELHLEGVVTDSAANQAYHLRAVEKISWEAKKVGETIWPASDHRLLNLYYRIAVHNYLRSLINNQGGESADSLRQFIPGLSQMKRSRLELDRIYYRVGLEMFRRMRQVFEASSPVDLQGIAMVDLYTADWLVLFGEGNRAEAYRTAYTGLLQAGVSESDIQQLFSQPRILPVSKFHPNLELAREALQTDNSLAASTTGSQPLIVFQEWSSSLPYIQVPVDDQLFPQQEFADVHTVQVAFRLEGIRRVGRWVSSRYVRNSSVPRNIQLLSKSANDSMNIDDLTERLHQVHFRPVLEHGVPATYEGILEYRYFPDERE